MSLALAINQFNFYKPQISVSAGGHVIEDQLRNITLHRDDSISLGWRSTLKENLREIQTNHNKADWDGYNALPINDESVNTAINVINELPENIIKPEITPEPSGNVSFDWCKGKDYLFSMSIDDNKLIFASIIGGNKEHAEIPFYEELPERVNKILLDYFLER